MNANPVPEPGQQVSRLMHRVLIIVEATSAGVGRHVIDLCRGLLTREQQVHLVYSQRRMDSAFEAGIRALGPKLSCSEIQLRTAPHPSDIAATVKIRRLLVEQAPFDIVHGHSSKGGALARLVAWGTPACSVYTPNGFVAMNPNLSRIETTVYRGCERFLGCLSDAIIAVTQQERTTIGKCIGRDDCLSVVPNCIDPPDFLTRAEARSRLQLESSEPVVGFIGRFAPQKNPLGMLQRFARVHQQCQAAKMVMIGDGPLQAEMHEFVKSHGLSNSVLFPGAVQAAPLLRAFDLVALPSLYEGMPYVILESLNAGLPIVASEVSGVAEMVRDSFNGFVVSPTDEVGFANRLLELVKSPELRDQFGSCSRELAGEFKLDRMIDQTLNVYDRALAASK